MKYNAINNESFMNFAKYSLKFMWLTKCLG